MGWRGLGMVLTGLIMAACSGSPPKDPHERRATDIYVLKGIQYMENGRLDVALQDLNRAIELDDSNVEAYNALGVLYERLSQPEAAEDQFKKALSVDKDNDSVANNYGRLLCSQGKYQEAMASFNKVMNSKLYPTPWIALTNAGLCAKKSGKKAEAETFLRKALEANPDFAPALLEMSKLSQENGNQLSARAFLQRFEAASKPTPESLWMGVEIERALGNGRDADAYLKKLQRFFPDSKEALRSRKNHSAY